MRKLVMLLILVSVLCVPLSAQEMTPEARSADEMPLIFTGQSITLMDPVTFAISSFDACVDTYGYALSPTGEWLTGAPVNMHLQVCNLITREVIVVPAPEAIISQSAFAAPAWSPDGRQIAWVAAYTDDRKFLMVYDLDTRENRIIVEDLPRRNRYTQLAWGESGILVALADKDVQRNVAMVYSPDGELLLDELAVHNNYTDYFWAVDSTGKEYLARYGGAMSMDIIDPVTRIPYLISGFEMYSLFAPDGLTVWLGYDPEGSRVELSNGDYVFVRDLAEYEDDFIPSPHIHPTNIAISPDGEAFAVFHLSEFIWRDGEVLPITDAIWNGDSASVIWGPRGYRIQGEPMDYSG